MFPVILAVSLSPFSSMARVHYAYISAELEESGPLDDLTRSHQTETIVSKFKTTNYEASNKVV